MSKNEISLDVTFNHYIPEEVILEFEKEFENSNFVLNLQKDKEEFYAFGSGEIITDVVIYFAISFYQLGMNDLITKPIYNMLKTSVINFYKKIKGEVKIRDAYGKSEVKDNNIQLEFEVKKDKSCKFNLVGNNLNDNTIDNMLDKTFDYLKNYDTNESKLLEDSTINKDELEKSNISFFFEDENENWSAKEYIKKMESMKKIQESHK